MPEVQFQKPCPACGRAVRLSSDRTHAVCTGCGRKYKLNMPQKGQTAPGSKLPPQSTGRPAAEGNRVPPRKTVQASVSEESNSLPKQIFREGSALLKSGGKKAGEALEGGYKKLRRRVNGMQNEISLPATKSERPERAPGTPPPQRLSKEQEALYKARRRQLEGRLGPSVPPPPPTKGEKFEALVSKYPRTSIALAAIALLLLSALLLTGVTKCVKESRINKNDFVFLIGETKEKATYAYVTGKGKYMRVNFSKIASLCNLTVTGTHAEPRYAVQDGSSSVTFSESSRIAMLNGNRYEMACPAEYKDGALWVDLYFADDIVGGITILVDTNENRVTVTRNATAAGTILNPVYETIVLSAGNRSIYTASGGVASGDLSYKIDMGRYNPYLEPNDKTYLILANKQNPLGEDHIPADLIGLTHTDVPTKREIELRECAAMALEALFLEMKADGITDIWVTSGYRSYRYQEALFDKYVNDYISAGLSYEDAIARVESDTARPGYSEHQTGLCVDLITSTMGGSLSNDFESTDAFRWLSENAWKFGFILRYPKDKTTTTGYTYESWHYRFVGLSAAAKMRESGWCFEEYLKKS